MSELRRPNCDPSVAAWISTVRQEELFLSVLVVGEIERGIHRLRRRGDQEQADVFLRWLATLESDYGDRLLPISLRVAKRWGALSAPATVPIVDALLAATALEHDLTLVTRDVGVLPTTGVRLLDPWSA